MKKFKFYICIQMILTMVLVISMQNVYAASNDQINIQVKTESLVKNVTVNDSMGYPFIDKNSRTLCPLRTVADSLGMQVEWNARDRSASFIMDQASDTIYGDNIRIVKTVKFKIGSNQYFKIIKKYYKGELQDDITTEILSMDTEPVIKSGRTYAPVRYLAEAFGYNVDWDPYEKTVIINASDSWIKSELMRLGYKENEIGTDDNKHNNTENNDQIKQDENKDESNDNVKETLPVKLNIDTTIPETTYEDSITITGSVENFNDDVILRLNNKAIKYSNDGTFKVTYDLDEGTNAINFKLCENDDVKVIKAFKIERLFDYHYEFNDTGITITEYGGKERNVVVPEQIDGFDVTGIGIRAFAGTNILSVVIPESVTMIDIYTFLNCEKLKSVVIKGHDFELAGNSPFTGCTSLESVKFLGDNITLREDIFWNMNSLKELEFSGNNVNIIRTAIEGCYNLKSFIISGDNFHIGKNGIYWCSIREITLSGLEGKLDNEAFYHVSFEFYNGEYDIKK